MSSKTKYTFTGESTGYSSSPNSKVSFELENPSRDELLRAFEDFLRGSGFVFEGHLEIVNEESLTVETVYGSIQNYIDEDSEVTSEMLDPNNE